MKYRWADQFSKRLSSILFCIYGRLFCTAVLHLYEQQFLTAVGKYALLLYTGKQLNSQDCCYNTSLYHSHCVGKQPCYNNMALLGVVRSTANQWSHKKYDPLQAYWYLLLSLCSIVSCTDIAFCRLYRYQVESMIRRL